MGWQELQLGERREKKRKKKTLKVHRNSSYDTIGTINKILMRRIQWYQERSPTMIRVSHSLFKGNWIITMKK